MQTMNIYTFAGSQWAQVVHLGIAYKKIPRDQYVLTEIDLGTAENFDPEYLKINQNGTVPSLTSPSLHEPLVDSGDILDHLDGHYPSFHQLTSAENSDEQSINDIVNLVHSERMSTNIIFFRVRNMEELRAKKLSTMKSFVVNRQNKLLECISKNPDHPFYPKKLEDESVLFEIFTKDTTDEEIFSTFFQDSKEAYAKLAAGMDQLNDALVLPYAAGHHETKADFHVIPWLAHAMWGAGGVAVDDFKPLEAVIRVSVPDFVVGPRIKEWWSHVSRCWWFQEVYPKLH